MMKPLSNLGSYLLVFRDPSPRRGRGASPRELGGLLSRWIEWHDSLDASGILHHCSAVVGGGCTIRRRPGSPAAGSKRGPTQGIVGYLVIGAASLDAAAAVARGCPGLEQGFEVDVFPAYDPARGRPPGADDGGFDEMGPQSGRN